MSRSCRPAESSKVPVTTLARTSGEALAASHASIGTWSTGATMGCCQDCPGRPVGVANAWRASLRTCPGEVHSSAGVGRYRDATRHRLTKQRGGRPRSQCVALASSTRRTTFRAATTNRPSAVTAIEASARECSSNGADRMRRDRSVHLDFPVPVPPATTDAAPARTHAKACLRGESGGGPWCAGMETKPARPGPARWGPGRTECTRMRGPVDRGGGRR